MEDPEQLHVPLLGHQVGNSVVTIQQNPDFPFCFLVALADLWKGAQNLDSFDNPGGGTLGRLGVVLGDVVTNLSKPA